MTTPTKYKISFDFHIDGEPQSELYNARFSKLIDNASKEGLKVEFSAGSEPNAEGLNLIKLVIDNDDEYITEDSSVTVKRTLKDYFAENGVPEMDEDVEDPSIRFLATTFHDEFGEACEEYERDNAPRH